MQCPYCNFSDSKVLDSRPVEGNREIRRRRECPGCRRRFTTYERVEEPPLWVVKRDGRRQKFDRQKVLQGVLTACEKRPVSFGQLEALTAEVERTVRDRGGVEVDSTVIGEVVIERLREIDEVAYVRFASVYRQFADVRGFREELERLLARRND